MRRLNALALVMFFLCNFECVKASRLANGDLSDGTATFSFAVGKIDINAESGSAPVVYAFSGQAATTTEGKKFAVAGMYADQPNELQPQFYPFSPDLITLNKAALTPNPFYGVKIGATGFYFGFPLFAVDGGTQLYWMNSNIGASVINALCSATLKDAAQADCSGIVAVSSFAGNYALAAVAPQAGAGVFGGINSGLTLVQKNSDNSALEQIGSSVIFDTTTPELRVGGAPLGALTVPVNLYFDSYLQRLYAGVTATAAVGARAASVCGAYLATGDSFALQKIAGDAAINSGTVIVGTNVGGATTTTHFVCTLMTTTGLSYLIVVNGTNGVYGLPLVNLRANPSNVTWVTDPAHGALANKNVLPVTYYTKTPFNNQLSIYYGRGFQTPALNAGDLYTSADYKAQVGGGNAPGTVVAMHAFKDTVFVTTSDNGVNERSGIFYSQALFDENGVIKGWTRWQRVVLGQPNNAALTASAYFVSPDILFSLQGGSSVRLTGWSNGQADGLLGGTTTSTSGSDGLVNEITALYKDKVVQGIFDFPRQMLVFNQVPGNEEAYMLITGYQQFSMIRTLSTVGGYFTPTISPFTSTTLADTGIILPPVGTISTITGSTTDALGAIVAASFVGIKAINQQYLFVGGTRGLAYADMSTGTGTLTLMNGFPMVIKLWVNEDVLVNGIPVLYVLTNTALYRLEKNSGAGFTPITLATIADLNLTEDGSFSDFVMSGTFGLLATSQGLFQSTNSITAATTSALVGWKQVSLPGSYTTTTRILSLSSTPLPYQFATHNNGGNIYVLAGSVGKNRAVLFRFTVDNTGSGFTLLPDENPVLQGSTEPYVYFDSYRNFFSTDGACSFSSNARDLTNPAFIQRMYFFNNGGKFAPRTINFGVPNATTITPLVRNSSLGSVIFGGNFGLLVHE